MPQNGVNGVLVFTKSRSDECFGTGWDWIGVLTARDSEFSGAFQKAFQKAFQYPFNHCHCVTVLCTCCVRVVYVFSLVLRTEVLRLLAWIIGGSASTAQDFLVRGGTSRWKEYERRLRKDTKGLEMLRAFWKRYVWHSLDSWYYCCIRIGSNSHITHACLHLHAVIMSCLKDFSQTQLPASVSHCICMYLLVYFFWFFVPSMCKSKTELHRLACCQELIQC